jgi:hypothetical protein
MDCEKCMNEIRLLKLEEDSKKNSETHEKFYGNFESLRTINAVKEERDKSIDKSLATIMTMIGEIKATIFEIQNRPIKQVDKLWDKILDKIVTFVFMAVVGYVLYVLK